MVNAHAGIGVDAGTNPAIRAISGFSTSLTRLGAGNYRLTMDVGLGRSEMLITVTVNDDITGAGACGVYQVTTGATTTIDVKTWVGSGLADLDFDLVVHKTR